MSRLIVGKITKAHGLKGELKVLPFLNDANLFKSFKSVFINGKNYNVIRCIASTKQIILGLNSIDQIEKVNPLLGKNIEVEKEQIELQNGQYFFQDLIGCEVFTANNISIGKIFDIQNFGASDVIFIKNQNNVSSVPYIENVFENVDIDNKTLMLSKRGQEVLCNED